MNRPVSVAMLVGAMATSGTASAQTVRFLKFTPDVIVPGQTAPVLMEVETTGVVPSQVALEPGGGAITATIALRDDGTGGDRVAGDRIYTCQLNAAQIVNAMRADDVHRVFLGFLNLFAGARYNIFADVYGADAGTYPITRLSQFVQSTPRLVNIQDPAYFISNDPAHVTQEFYRWFGDDFDLLNLIYSPERIQNRNHFTVKNSVDGIGLARTDNTGRYGSAGRLQGISQFPIPGFYDGAENGFIHELGHQWINFLNFPPLAPGIPHWPPSSMAGGVMGFSIGGSGGEGGDFRCIVTDQNGVVSLAPRTDAAVFHDFDLYLMGLLPAAQVRQQVVFTNVTSPPSCIGQVYTGAVQRVSVQDIINRYGPRVPAAGATPPTFRLATVLVTRDDLATPEGMWLYNWFTERAESQTRLAVHSGFVKEIGQPFYLATGGRGTLDTRVTAAGQDDFKLIATPTAASVAAGTSATLTISAMPQLTTFDATVSFSCSGLPTHASCVFSPSQVVPGTTGKDVALTITTKDASASTAVRPIVALTVVAGGWLLRGRRGSRRPWRFAAAIALAAVACGGNSTPPMSTPTPTPTPTTTPPGTYAIAVVGTSGVLQRSATVTLTVQ